MSIRIRFYLGSFVLAFGSPAAQADTLQAELDRKFVSIASACLGAQFKPNELKKQDVYGQKIKTAIPNDFLQWDPIKDYLFTSVNFNNNGALDLEFAKIVERVGNEYKEFGTPLDIFWNKLDRPLFATLTDNTTREHNCITYLKGTASLDVNPGFLSAAVDASVKSERAVTTFAYAGDVLSPYAWAAGLLTGDAATARPAYPRVNYLLRMWEWYRANPAAADKALMIYARLTGIGISRLEKVDQNALLETQYKTGFGFGPFSASAQADAQFSSTIQSQVNDFDSAVLKYQSVSYIPNPQELVRKISDEIRLLPSPDNVGSVGSSSFNYVASLSYMTEKLCVQSAWKSASTGGFSEENFLVERTASGGCKFTLTLRPPAAPAEELPLTFAVESPLSSDRSSSALRFALARESFSDNRLLISFDPRVPAGLTIPSEPLIDGRDFSFEFAVRERRGARLGDVQPNASRATIACGGLTARSLSLSSAALETREGNKIVRLQARIDAGLLNELKKGEVAECAINAGILAERYGPGAGSQNFTLPTVRFVVRKESPAPASVVAEVGPTA